MNIFDKVTKVVQFDNENSITLRALTFGEEEVVKKATTKVTSKLDGTGEAVFDPTQGTQMVLEMAICEWAGPWFGGRPVTPENIAALPPWLTEQLKEPLNELRKGPTGDSEAKKLLVVTTN